MDTDARWLQQFIQALWEVYPDLRARDILEIFWLAQYTRDTLPAEQTSEQPALFTAGEGQSALDTPLHPQPSPERPPLSPSIPHNSASPGSSLASTPRDPVYPHSNTASSISSQEARPAYPISSPPGAALPKRLEIARSLRPLLRKVPSRTVQTLDEEATVRRIAETRKKLKHPVRRSASERWLDVALVIDAGASMIIWQKTIEEFKALLENLGAFRNIYVWHLMTDEQVTLHRESNLSIEEAHTRESELSAGGKKRLASHDYRELLDPHGRRLILFISDCVSHEWRSGKVQELLNRWGNKNIVALVQMLPSRMWGRTALGYADIVQVNAPTPGCINAQLDVQDSILWFNEQQRKTCTCPIPVFTLQPSSSGTWAKMITGVVETWTTGVIFDLDYFQNPRPPVAQKQEGTMTGEERVRRFQRVASPMAMRLAEMLAAVPISLPVMRLVQSALLPGSSQVDLAEVFLSGLLKKVSPAEALTGPDYVAYDFVDNVRDVLLNRVPLPRAFEVFEKVSTYITRHWNIQGFKAFAAPHAPLEDRQDAIALSKDSAPLALIEARLWRRVGGGYNDLADEIQKAAEGIHSPLSAQADSPGGVEGQAQRHVSTPVPEEEELVPTRGRFTSSYLPFPHNPLFQSRPGEFERLEKLFFGAAAAGPPVVGLVGMAGIGKTQLAIEFAYRYQDHFAAGIFWTPVPGKNLFDWQHQLAELAVKTGYLPADGEPVGTENEQWRAAHFCGYLAGHADALLILDNVEEPELITNILPTLAGQELACTILYTSRNLRNPPGARQYIVQALPEEAALRLLLEHNKPQVLEAIIAGRTNAETNAARALCQYVGYLPLTLTHLRVLLELDPRRTLTILVNELAQSKHRDILETLFQSLRISWGYINERARELFKLASCFPEITPLPLWLLGIMSGLGENSHLVRIAYEQLRNMSFVEALAGEQVRLHPLLRDFGQRIMQEEGEAEGYGEDILRENAVRHLLAEFSDLQKLEQRALQSYWGCLEQVRIAYEYTEMLKVQRGQLLKQVERWLVRESYLLADRQWWPRLIPELFYQQLYNHAVEEDITSLEGKPPGQWIHQEGAVRAGHTVLLFDGHTRPVLSIAFSPDGARVLTGSEDGTLHLWEAASGRRVLQIKTPSPIWSAAFSPDGSLILAGSAARVVQLWAATNGQEVLRLEGHRGLVSSVAFSPDSKRVVTGSWDETARIWDVTSGQEVERLETSRINSVAFSPEGRYVLVGLWGGVVQLWDTADREAGEVSQQFVGHTEDIRSVAFSPDGRRVLSGADDRTARVWDVATGQELLCLRGHHSQVSSVAFSPDGKWILTGSWDETVRVWDAVQGREFRREELQDRVRSVAFSPDGKRVLAGSDDRTARLWDIEDEQVSASLRDQMDMVECMSFSADGQRLAIGTNEGMIRVWDAKTSRELARWRSHDSSVKSVAFSPDGQRILTGTAHGTIKLWEGMPGRLLGSLPKHHDLVTCVAFSPVERRMLTGSRDGTVQLWGTESRLALLKYPFRPGDMVTSAAFSANGKQVLTGGASGTVMVWDSHSGEEVSRLSGHTDSVNSVTFSQDGTYALSSSDDGTVRLWEIGSRRELATLSGPQKPLRSAAFSPSGRLVVACDGHEWVFFWQLGGPNPRKPRGLYVGAFKIGALYWVDEAHLLLADTGGSLAHPHFYRLHLEGKW